MLYHNFYREPDELWNDIKEIVKDTADKKVPKAKRKKVTKWLSDEAMKIADERRKARNKGNDEKYRILNAAFQRRARKDKEMSIQEKCRQIEESNRMGRTRDLFKEIRHITGSLKCKMWSHKIEPWKGSHRRQRGKRKVAAVYGRTIQKRS